MNSEAAASMRAQLMAIISGEGLMDKIKGAATDFANAWDLVFIAIILIILSGVLWLWFMRQTSLTSCLVWSCMLCVSLMLAASVYFAHALLVNAISASPNCQGANAIEATSWPSKAPCATGELQFYFVLQIICGLSFVLFVLLCFVKRDAIALAIKVVGAAAEALGDLGPKLMFLPALTICYKIIIVFIFM